MEYYLATKKNELFIHTTSGMDVRSIMLSKKASLKRVTCWVIPLRECSPSASIRVIETRSAVAKNSGWEVGMTTQEEPGEVSCGDGTVQGQG